MGPVFRFLTNPLSILSGETSRMSTYSRDTTAISEITGQHLVGGMAARMRRPRHSEDVQGVLSR